MTIKQTKYVDALIRFGNKREAVIQAGYKVKSRRNADSVVNWLNHCPQVSSKTLRLLDQAGFSDKEIVQRLAESIEIGWGINAKHSDALYALTIASKIRGPLRNCVNSSSFY